MKENDLILNEKQIINSPLEVPVPLHISDTVSIIEPNKQFKLAPTPAQLGRAPLQRRQSMGNFIYTKFSTQLIIFPALGVPTSTSTVTTDCSSVRIAEHVITIEPPMISPSTKKSFFKKNVEDGMDR